MLSKLGAAVGDAEAEKQGRKASYTPAGSPRDLIPSALVHCLTAIIEELPEAPSWQRVELRNLRARLCRVFKLPLPSEPANHSDVEQMLAEDDGTPLED